jgi:hypothetical protein
MASRKLPATTRENDAANDLLEDVDRDGDSFEVDDEGNVLKYSRLGVDIDPEPSE